MLLTPEEIIAIIKKKQSEIAEDCRKQDGFTAWVAGERWNTIKMILDRIDFEENVKQYDEKRRFSNDGTH